MENIIFIDCIAAASEVFQKSVSDKDASLYCSELQRNAVSVSFCCITNHSKMWLKTKLYYFLRFCKLAPNLLCQFGPDSLKQLHSAGGSAGLKGRDGGMCGSGWWLLAGYLTSLLFGLSSSGVG